MIEQIVIVTGMLAFIDALFHKWRTWDSIRSVLENQGEKLNKKFIFQLATCMFCQRFWIAVIITLILGFISEYTKSLVLVPMIAIGLFNLLNQKQTI